MGDEVLAGLPFLARVALAGEREGALDLLALDRLGQLGLVLGDDGEEVAQQGALLVAQLARDRVGTRGAAALGGLAYAQVTLAIAVLQLLGALLCRNRLASSCLATQATYARDRSSWVSCEDKTRSR